MRKVYMILAAVLVLFLYPRPGSTQESWAVIDAPDDIQIMAFFNDTIYAKSPGQSRLYVVEGDNLDKFTELKTPDGNPLQLYEHKFPMFAHMPHVLLGGGVLAQGTGGFYLVKGKEVIHLCYEDGSPVKGYVTRHSFGNTDCPYVVVGRDLLHIKDGKAIKVTLPKEVIVPQIAQVADITVLAVSNKYWSLIDGEVTPLMDDDGEPFASFSSLNMRGVGAYLLINGVTPGDSGQRLELYHVTDDALKHVKLPEGEVLGQCEMIGGRVVLTIGKSREWLAMEPDGTKLKPIAALKKLKLEDSLITSLGAYALLRTGRSSVHKDYLFDGTTLTACRLPQNADRVERVPFMRTGDRVVAQVTVRTGSTGQGETRWYSLSIDGTVTEQLSLNMAGGPGKFWYERVWCTSYGIYASRITLGGNDEGNGDGKREVVFKRFAADAAKD